MIEREVVMVCNGCVCILVVKTVLEPSVCGYHEREVESGCTRFKSVVRALRKGTQAGVSLIIGERERKRRLGRNEGDWRAGSMTTKMSSGGATPLVRDARSTPRLHARDFFRRGPGALPPC